jgi:hypothetical protein
MKKDNRKTHFVDTHFNWKTKCGKLTILRRTTIFTKCVTCSECLKRLKANQ